jgi:diguanylate cyclase (GGDEF)-like protein
MGESIDRCKAWFRAVQAEYDAVADEALMLNMRLRWMAFVVAPLGLILGGGYWLSTTGGPPHEVAWSHAHAWADFSMAAVMAVLGLGAHQALKQGRATAMARWLIVLAVAWTLGITVVIAAIDQLFLSDITPFLFGCITVGAVPLMRPRLALPMFLGAYGLLYHALAITQQDPVLLHIGRVTGLAAVFLSFGVSMVLWHQASAGMLRNKTLRDSNEALAAKQRHPGVRVQRDELTGLYNRWTFTRLAENELARAGRYPCDTSIIMVDIDFFRNINDAHGHLAGDAVLKHVAAVLSSSVRHTDVVARVGGEEFIVMLSQTPVEAAVTLAEKLRVRVQDSPAQVDDLQIPVTASFGVAGVAAGQAGTVGELYTAADSALYDAKHQGRNRVKVCAVDSQPGTDAG